VAVGAENRLAPSKLTPSQTSLPMQRATRVLRKAAHGHSHGGEDASKYGGESFFCSSLDHHLVSGPGVSSVPSLDLPYWRLRLWGGLLTLSLSLGLRIYSFLYALL
jgi:hypothetical protein